MMLISIGSSFSIFSQTRELDRGEFYSLKNAAHKKRYESSRRETMKINVYSGGVLKRTKEEIEEFLTPDKQRYILVEKSGNKTQKLELVKMGKNYYQRKDDRKWTKEKTWNRGGSLVAIPTPISSSYTVEKKLLTINPFNFTGFSRYIMNVSRTKEKKNKLIGSRKLGLITKDLKLEKR